MRQQIGIIWGVWDLFHIGHLNTIEKASRECNILFIGVFSDEATKSYKGQYPIIPEHDRIRILQHLNFNCIPFMARKREHMSKTTFPVASGVDIVFVSERLAGKDLAMVNRDTFRGRIHYLPYTEGISTGKIIDIIQSGVIQ